MREDDEIERSPALAEEWLRQNNLIYGGLIGIGVLLVQPYVTSTSVPTLGLATVILFAIAIPMLAALMLLNQYERYHRRAAPSVVVTIGRPLAMLAALSGIVTAFWQISWIAGVALLVSGVVAVLVHSAGYVRLDTAGGDGASGTSDAP
jgi:O-antigen/teichoic acid export membrane protein